MIAASRPAPLLGVQYLRAIAALAVLVFHVGEAHDLPFKFGAAGVDVFFVISGLIMWITTADRTMSPGEFMYRRITRVVPIYWLATLATAIGISLKPAFFFEHDASPANLVGSFLFLPLVKDGGLHPVVIQGWTLSFEMLFYGIFALALFLPRHARIGAIVAVLAALSAAHPFLAEDNALGVLTRPLLLEFGAGVLLGAAWMKGRTAPASLGLAAICVALALLVLNPLQGFAADRVIKWGVPAVLLVAGTLSLERRGWMPEVKLLHFLGDASYSIYIWHVFTSVIATALLLRLGASEDIMISGTIALALAGTLIAYWTLERPLIKMFRVRRRETLSQAA